MAYSATAGALVDSPYSPEQPLPSGSCAEPFVLREQDRLLPAANIARIMAGALPDGAKISREAKRFMQECVSEFICFLTSEVNDRCQQRQQRLMTARDFITALHDLDLADFAAPAEAMLPHMGSSRPERDGTPAVQMANAVPGQLREQHLQQVSGGGDQAASACFSSISSSLATTVSTEAYFSDGMDLNGDGMQGEAAHRWWHACKRLRMVGSQATAVDTDDLPFEKLLGGEDEIDASIDDLYSYMLGD